MIPGGGGILDQCMGTVAVADRWALWHGEVAVNGSSALIQHIRAADFLQFHRVTNCIIHENRKLCTKSHEEKKKFLLYLKFFDN